MHKNIWKFWSLFCVTGAVIFILIPQIWIAFSSLLRTSGNFTLELNNDKINIIDADLEGFRVISDNQNKIYLLNDYDQELVLTLIEPGLTKIETNIKNFININRIGVNKLNFNSKNLKLRIEQLPPSFLFGDSDQAAEKKLKIIPVDDYYQMQHLNKTYITVVDSYKHLSFKNFFTVFKKSKYLSAITNSLIVTVVSSIIATIFAVPLAWFIARYNFKFRNGIIILVTMASVSPPFLGAYAWRLMLGSSGFITNFLGLDFSIMGMHGVIWVIIWLIYPLIFLTSLDSFMGMDPTLTESAHSLGASRVKAFLNIEIPLAMPGIITGLYLAGITAFSDFGTPMIITLNLEMLPKLIYQEFMNEIGGETHIASAGSMVMIFISGIFLAGQRLFLASKSFSSITASKRQLDKPNTKIKLFIYIFSFLILSISFLPHIVVIITSFFEWGSGVVTNNLTLVNYKDLINTELLSIWVSLSTATGATILSFVFGTTIAYILIRKNYKIINFILNTLVMIPLIIPGTVFAIGLILVFNDEPIVLTGTWLILTLSYFLRRLPFAVKTSEATLYQMHPALEEAALSLGSKPLRVFVFITIPIMISGAITGMTLVFLRSITELSSTILLFRPPWKTMSIVIFERTIAPGTNFGIAASMAVLMMLITYLPLYLLSRGRNFEVA